MLVWKCCWWRKRNMEDVLRTYIPSNIIDECLKLNTVCEKLLITESSSDTVPQNWHDTSFNHHISSMKVSETLTVTVSVTVMHFDLNKMRVDCGKMMQGICFEQSFETVHRTSQKPSETRNESRSGGTWQYIPLWKSVYGCHVQIHSPLPSVPESANIIMNFPHTWLFESLNNDTSSSQKWLSKPVMRLLPRRMLQDIWRLWHFYCIQYDAILSKALFKG